MASFSNAAPSSEGSSLFSENLPQLLPKIRALASAFAREGETEDMVQEGLIALYSCCSSFDPSRGVPFEAYAMTCVRRRLISAADSPQALRVPSGARGTLYISVP